MTSNYPAGFDSYANRANGTPVDASHVNDLQDAMAAVEGELGLDPAGAAATVRARLDTLDATVAGKAATAHTHAASDIASGLIAASRLGAGTPSPTTFLRGDQTWATPSGGGGPGGGGALLVASVEAPDSIKDRADYVCDGVDDQATLQAAWNASVTTGAGTPYGAIEVSHGRFNLSGALYVPGRGCSLFGQGAGSELRIDAASAAAFDASGGQGSAKALIMFGTGAESQNAQGVMIGRLGLNCAFWNGSSWVARGVGGIVLDQTNGGSTSGSSYGTYGWPNGPTDGDTYHRVTDLYYWYVTYGVRFVGGASTNTRGNNVVNCRGARVSIAGYSSDSASDCHFSQCHVIGSIASNAVGFLGGGGSTRFTGCKAAYFMDTGSYGFDLSSTRISAGDCESQDNLNGVRVGGADARITGMRVETQESPCDVAFALQGNNAIVSGLYIHTRNTGTWARGLQFDSTTDDHFVDALIDPTGITTAVSVNTGANITDPANLPRGAYRIRVIGNPGTTLTK